MEREPLSVFSTQAISKEPELGIREDVALGGCFPAETEMEKERGIGRV